MQGTLGVRCDVEQGGILLKPMAVCDMGCTCDAAGKTEVVHVVVRYRGHRRGIPSPGGLPKCAGMCLDKTEACDIELRCRVAAARSHVAFSAW